MTLGKILGSYVESESKKSSDRQKHWHGTRTRDLLTKHVGSFYQLGTGSNVLTVREQLLEHDAECAVTGLRRLLSSRGESPNAIVRRITQCCPA